MKRKRHILFLLTVFLLTVACSMSCEAGWKKSKGKTRYYVTATKSYVKSTWKKIGGKWYYFDAKGYLKTGRFKQGGDYYYVTRSAGRYTNRKKGNYYYGSDGKMVKSCWKKIRKKWFYFGANGKLKTGRFTVDKKTYYCTKSAGRVTKKKVGDYYYGADGVMVTNKWVGNYYYGSNGKAKYGKFTIDGKTYCCTKKSGKVKGQWYKKNYYDKNGVMATSQWIGSGSNKSYVDATGKITKGNKNPRNPLSSSEEKLLASLVYCEAGNQPYKGKVAVASVVINRMESSRFPNTLRGVIYQSGQFTPASNGLLSEVYYHGRYNGSAVSSSQMKACKKAAKLVSENGSQLKGYYYFNCISGRLKIGDHYFS